MLFDVEVKNEMDLYVMTDATDFDANLMGCLE